jgi:hypothetical protein
MYIHGLWYYVKYEMFEWGALWGNPNIGMACTGTYPIIRIDEVIGGIGLGAKISNVGTGDASDVAWTISVEGGIFGFVNLVSEGTIATLAVDEQTTVTIKELLLGVGIIDITIEAGIDSKPAQGIILGPYVFILP